MTIFISTYDKLINIGLLKNGKLLAQKEAVSERSHSNYLMPLIDSILKENKISVNEINEVIVINGPGSFTGVRLGVTVAKTFSYTLSIPIKVINTLDALALSDEAQDQKIIKVDDAKGSYYGLYENNKLISELNYLNEDDFNKLLANNNYKLVNVNKLDIEAICNSLIDNEPLNPHEIKPIYIKMIEVLNDK